MDVFGAIYFLKTDCEQLWEVNAVRQKIPCGLAVSSTLHFFKYYTTCNWHEIVVCFFLNEINHVSLTVNYSYQT